MRISQLVIWALYCAIFYEIPGRLSGWQMFVILLTMFVIEVISFGQGWVRGYDHGKAFPHRPRDLG